MIPLETLRDAIHLEMLLRFEAEVDVRAAVSLCPTCGKSHVQLIWSDEWTM
jgi:hypothetical protein